MKATEGIARSIKFHRENILELSEVWSIHAHRLIQSYIKTKRKKKKEKDG